MLSQALLRTTAMVIDLPRHTATQGDWMDDWPFDDPENVASITVRQILQGGQPILYVSHDADDRMWQFLTGGPVDVADAMIVSLREVYSLDPSIGELADLPLGWTAERSASGKPWQRSSS